MTLIRWQTIETRENVIPKAFLTMDSEQANHQHQSCMLVIKRGLSSAHRGMKRMICHLFMLATLIIRGLLIRLGRGLCFAHTYSCEGGTPVLHGTAYGHESGVIANEAQGGRQQGIPKTVYKSCALHLALCESPDKGWQELMPQFQRWCLNRQLRADTDDTTWPKPGLPFNSHCLNQEHIQSQLAMLLSKQQKVIVRTSLIVTVHHFSYNTWCEMKRRSCAPVCSTCSFLPSSLLVWAALPLLGNRLQDELLGFTPERQ